MGEEGEFLAVCLGENPAKGVKICMAEGYGIVLVLVEGSTGASNRQWGSPTDTGKATVCGREFRLELRIQNRWVGGWWRLG